MNPTRLGPVATTLLAILATTACSPPHETETPEGTSSTNGTSTSTEPTANLPPDLSVPPVVWANPGGMWMPEQVSAQADILKKIGFQIDPAAFSKPTEFPLGAVVSLGGCSASFVSPDGLIITNHHCVIGALQYNSTPENDLLKNGYLAKKREDEKSNGPASRVFVTTKFTDVTKDVRDGLDKLTNDLARFQQIEDRQKKLVGTCEAGKSGVKCSVASYFGGAQFTLVEQLEIKDVRLVYSPQEGIGSYGGETDNWRWPRHSGDFGFYRAYVGKDGNPADYSTSNVPYKPAHYLRVAKTELKPGDPVMVTGYPAKTDRYTTAAETQSAVTWDHPHTIKFTEVYLEELNKVAALDKGVAQKAETFIRGLANWQTNTRGQLDGLTKDGLAQKKTDNEAILKKWIDEDAARKKKFGGNLEKMDKLLAEHDKTREGDAVIRETMRMTRLLAAAHTIVKNAEERDKADDKRDPDFQDRNQPRIEASLKALSKAYDPRLDVAMLALSAKRDAKLDKALRAGVAEALLAQTTTKVKSPDVDAQYETTAKTIYAETKLGDEAARIELFKTAKLADLKKSTDPLIKLALAIRPSVKAAEDRDKKFAGAMATLRPLFVESLKDKTGGAMAPDANRTLRVTFGTVRGYSPTPDKPLYYPFTKLSELVAKNTGTGDFEAPKALLDAYADKKFGKYVDTKMREVPVNFLSDLDITGGNSGSPTLDGRGDLVGLAFDGNYESMASDWLFMPEVTRTIHVDIRYVLWVMDAVGKADNLLTEMGVTPSAR